MGKRTLGFLLVAVMSCAAVLSGCTAETQNETNITYSGDSALIELATEDILVSDEPIYEYETQEMYAAREGNQIYGIIYIPKNAGEKMPAIIYSHGFGGSHQYGAD